MWLEIDFGGNENNKKKCYKTIKQDSSNWRMVLVQFPPQLKLGKSGSVTVHMNIIEDDQKGKGYRFKFTNEINNKTAEFDLTATHILR